MILKKFIIKKHDFEEKIIFEKQILKNNFAHKPHVLIQFTSQNAQILHFTCNFKKHDFEEKKIFKRNDFEKKILKSLVYNEKVFVKSMILN